MSLDKAIKYGKEKRRPYRKAKLVSKSCRNHGTCPYCKANRLFKFRDRHPENTKNTSPFMDMMSE